MFVACASCGKRVSDRAPACPFCGTALAPVQSELRPALQPSVAAAPAPASPAPVAGPAPTSARQAVASLPAFVRGDFIGDGLQVLQVLGEGGFGVVYLVVSQGTGETLALKTVRSELLRDEAARALFLKEARIWIELGQHPYLVRARWLDEINGRPYLAMEYVRGRPGRPNDLEGYLRTRPPDLAQALAWAIQFCHGMEYAYGRGIRCHRDIKPANVLIGEDERVRISDFGIAGLALLPDAPGGGSGAGAADPGQTALGTVFGTPTHMSPEQFEGAAGCDERSDVYSFGVMLFQMAAQGRLPLVPAAPPPGVAPGAWYFHALRQLHRASPPPALEGPLGPIVARALAKRPEDRPAGFAALRAELEAVFRQRTGREPEPPPAVEETAADVSNRGLTLTSLGRHEEALAAYDQALALAPGEPKVHSNRASALRRLGRHAEALAAAERAIALDGFAAGPWLNKGLVLVELEQLDEAVAAFDRSLALDPRSAEAWVSKGVVLGRLGREAEELGCLERATELDPRDPIAWFNLGSLLSTRRDLRGVACFDRALALDPRAEAPWGARGVLFSELGRFAEAVASLDEAIRLAPAEPRNWYNKGNALLGLGSTEAALGCFAEATRLAPLFPTGWYNRALAALQLRRAEEALAFFSEYLRLAPVKDPLRAAAERLADELRAGQVPQVVTRPGAERVQDTGMNAPRTRVAATGEPAPAEARVAPGPEPTTTQAETTVQGASAPAAPVPAAAPPPPPAPPPPAPPPPAAPPAPSAATTAPALPRPPLPARPTGTVAEWNDRAGDHFEQRRFAESLAAAEAALALDPTNATGLNNKANALFGLGRGEDAVRVHEQLVEIAPVFVPSWCNRAAILSRCGRKPEALRAFLETIELAADDAGSPQLAQARQSVAALQREGVRPAARTHHGLLAAGYRAMVRGQGAQAIAAFDAAVRAAPQRPACWEWKASALRELGRFDEALACASEGVRAAGDAASLHHERGLALVQLRRFEQAVAAFEDAIRADPLAPAAWSDRGKALGVLHRLEEARDSLARATELAPQHPAPWQNMALVEEELGLHGEAARSYARFLERATPDMRLQVEQARSRIPLLEAQARARRGEPLRAPAVPVVELPAVRPVAGAEPVEAATPVVIPPAPVPEVKERVPFADAIRRAQLNLNQGQAERALAFFDQALAADPANAGAWAGKAEALSRLGRHAESIAHADRALALNPRLVEVWQRRAAGYEALRRYPEALASWDGGLAVAPKSLPLLNGRGLALYYLGRLEEAEAAFEAVLALEPRHALARFNRAHVDLKVGRSAEAARGFRQFLALAPPQLGSQIADARARLAALESP